METKFTKDQLQEIEKVFDIQASLTSKYYADIFNSVAKVEGSKEILTKLLNEFADTFKMYREISARAHIMLM